jgi:hypothetical protein
VETDINILAIARAAIAEFGSNAAQIMDRRAADHRRAGEADGVELWGRVANAIREIFAHQD